MREIESSERSDMKISALIKTLLLLGFVALLAMTIAAFYEGRVREESRTLLRLGLEDVALRVRAMEANFRAVREMSDSAALAKAHAVAKLVAANPLLVREPARLKPLAKELDVDEIHVSDSAGVLVASLPELYRGYSMASSQQSSAFMPAITNSDFALVQAPMSKGISTGGALDAQVFQYAGVSRIDAPGIIQIGYNAQRIEDARRLADIDEISRTARVGRDGAVTIVSNAGLPPPNEDFTAAIYADGRRHVQLETNCGDYRIRVDMPERDSFLAEANCVQDFVVADIIFLLIILISLPGSRESIRRDAELLKTLFGGGDGRKGAFSRAIRNPVTLACAIVFIGATGIAWVVISRTSMAEARARLLAADADMSKSVDTCVDNLLFYQGSAIVRHYKTPEAMTSDTVNELMGRYGLDELNIINGEGVILLGALADVGYRMSSNPKSAEFNCLLQGEKVFSQAFRPPIEDPSGPRRKYVGVAFPPPAKGYIQMGFKEIRLASDIDYWFEEEANDWHIGETGFYILADDETGAILSCGASQKPGLTLAGIGFDVTAAPKSPGTFFTATLFGKECLCLTRIQNFHRIVSAIPFSEIRSGTIRIILLASGVLLAVFVLVVFFMTRLSDLVTSLRSYIKKDAENRAKDFAIARTIQASSLPVSFPDEPGWRILAAMQTAREVGGDFYDFYRTRTGKVFFLVADVSGKGVPAAMFMMKARTIIKACIFDYDDDIAAAVEDANNRLATNNDANMFVTAWLALFDPERRTISYVNAGHNPPLIRRADGTVEWVRGRPSLVLAAAENVKYRVETLALKPGDTLFLYTDGVTEAMNAAGELYGEARLEQTITASKERLIQSTLRDLAAFVKGAEQSDDITALTLEIKTT